MLRVKLKQLFILIGLALCFSLFSPVKQAKAQWVLDSYNFGNNTDKVPYCSLSKQYKEFGLTLFYLKDLKDREKFLIGFRLDMLKQGQSYPITLSFEKRGAAPTFVEVEGQALQNDLLSLDFSSDMIGGQALDSFSRLTIIGMDESMSSLKLGDSWVTGLNDMNICIEQLADQTAELIAQQEKEREQAEAKKNTVFVKKDDNPNAIKDILNLAKVPFTDLAPVQLEAATNEEIVSWSGRDVVGIVRDIPFKPTDNFEAKAETFIYEVGQLCGEGYVNDVHPTETIGTMQTIRAEIACSDQGRDSVSAILFVKRSGDMLVFMQEGLADNAPDTIKIRNDIFQVFRKIGS